MLTVRDYVERLEELEVRFECECDVDELERMVGDIEDLRNVWEENGVEDVVQQLNDLIQEAEDVLSDAKDEQSEIEQFLEDADDLGKMAIETLEDIQDRINDWDARSASVESIYQEACEIHVNAEAELEETDDD